MSNALLSSKVVVLEEEPTIRNISGVSTTSTGIVGVTERGPVDVATLVTSKTSYAKIFGGYTENGHVAQAVDGFFAQTGDTGQVWVTRVVHHTDITDPATKTSIPASVDLLTSVASPTAGSVTGSAVEPFDFAPGDTLQVATDGGSGTATFAATAAAVETTNAETFALVNAATLTVKVNGGAVQTITFLTAEFASIGAATAEEVAAVINAKIVGASASVTSGGTKVTITSDRMGTSSGVEVTGGTANVVLGFATAPVAGTGNVSNIDAVTVVEIKSAVEAAVPTTLVTSAAGAVRIARTGATGPTATVQVQAASTADTILQIDNAVHSGSAGTPVATLRVSGKTDGTYAHQIRAVVSPASNGEAASFNFGVEWHGVIVKTYPNATMDDASPNYIETLVNGVDDYVSVLDLGAGIGVLGDRPATGTSSYLSGGSDGLAGLSDTDFIGASSNLGKTGIRCLDRVQDIALLIVPGRATAAVANAQIAYGEVTRDRQVFTILTPPPALTEQDVVTYFETTANVLGFSEFAAAYWPRLKVPNPSTAVFGSGSTIFVDPGGYIAGAYARVDASKPGGVYTPPAGIENGRLFGVLGFESESVMEEAARDVVSPKGINPITSSTSSGPYIDGSDLIKSNGNFPSVAERRGAIFIEQSIKAGLQFARHRNIDEALQDECTRTVDTFLGLQLRNGAFRYKTPSKAYFVDFGDGLNTEATKFAKQLLGRIGIATQKPAKWLILSFSQKTLGAS